MEVAILSYPFSNVELWGIWKCVVYDGSDGAAALEGLRML